jgi:hypothetical protein
MAITSQECEWHRYELKILGRTITGLRGFEYGDKSEDEYLYGAGNKPIDIQEGNISYEGNIKVLGYEKDQLNDAARLAGYDSLTRVPHELITITVTYKKNALSAIRKDVITGVKFQEQKNTMEQGAKNREVTLPFLAMGVK